MPKRPCPFEDDDLLPQLKVHVGQKQVDNGVCSEERMKDVYDRTMDLLKEGVKTLSRKLNESMEINATEICLKTNSRPFKSEQRNSKQMVLNSNLGLLGVDKAIKDVRPKYDVCGCSRVIDQSMLNKCSYCDQVLCSHCLSECANCSELFCQNCSLPVYNVNDDHNMCLNCYR